MFSRTSRNLKGVTLAYAETLDVLPEALEVVRPTVLVSVPRVFEKMYGKILDAASRGSYVKKVLVHWSVRTCREWASAELEPMAVTM